MIKYIHAYKVQTVNNSKRICTYRMAKQRLIETLISSISTIVLNKVDLGSSLYVMITLTPGKGCPLVLDLVSDKKYSFIKKCEFINKGRISTISSQSPIRRLDLLQLCPDRLKAIVYQTK